MSDSLKEMGVRSPIHVLSDDVTNKIAAGEVIERPASVVKELVENAIDAGAGSVRVEVKGGGKELLRVTDDGQGVAAEEAPLAFERHATSKIQAAEDLVGIRSLGFRGEALPSIASVSKVGFVTRTSHAETAVRLEVTGGTVTSSPFGAPGGTQVTVRDLFYNTPARFKFLKTDATERRYIAEYVTHMALAHAGIAFRLTMEGRESLASPGTGNIKEAIAAVYGRDILRDLVAVEWDSPWATITGYVGKPSLAKGNRSAESVFVNGRWVRNRLLGAAIEKGFESLLAHRRFPLAILHTRVEPSLIDVNVHPAKTEIRFKDERETFKAVMLAVRKALTSSNLVVDVTSRPAGKLNPAPSHPAPDATPLGGSGQARLTWGSAHGYVSEALPGPVIQPRDDGPEWQGERRSEAPYPMAAASAEDSARLGVPTARQTEMQAAGESQAHTHLPLAENRAEGERVRRTQELIDRGMDPRELLSEARVVGQVVNTYLLVPIPAGLWLIDQHVAHERILYEQVLSKGETDGSVTTQELLVPQPLSFSPGQAAALAEHVDDLTALGFIVERFGGTDYLLRSVPAALAGRAAGLVALLEELVTVAAEGGPSLRERAAATVACRGAVKAGDLLQPEERDHLVRALATVENPFACPHGRPIILQMHVAEIERRFGRA